MFIPCLLRLRLFAISQNRPSRHMSRQEISDVIVRKLCHIRSLTRRCCCYSGKPVTVVSPSYSNMHGRISDVWFATTWQHTTLYTNYYFFEFKKKRRVRGISWVKTRKIGDKLSGNVCTVSLFASIIYDVVVYACSLIRFRTTRRILKKSLRMQFRPFWYL
jgi:hypothetical protein